MPKGNPPCIRAARIALPALPALALLALALPPLVLPPLARAQDEVSGYSLPPVPRPSAQGPVDSSVPVIVPVIVSAAPSPDPAQVPAAARTASAPAAAPSPQPAGATRATRTSPAASAPTASQPGAAAAPARPAPAVDATPPAPLPQPQATARPAPASPFGSALPFAALAIAVLLAGAAFALRRKPAPAMEEPQDRSPAPAPLSPPGPPPSPPPGPPPLPRPAFAAPRIACALTAPSLQLSMLNATLDYRLRLANHGERASGALAVRADLSFAHAALGAREQLDPRDRKLDLRHEHPGLAPDEEVELAGKLRLPLAQIQPVPCGRMLLFVPLARFIVQSPQGGETFVFTFGGENPRAGGGLAPIRIDLGPRAVTRLATRAIDAQRWLTLDPAPQAS